VTKASYSVVAKAFAASVSKHSDDLGVFLAFYLEFKFAFRFFAISLSSPAVFPAFA
jgi:hypothetical protein